MATAIDRDELRGAILRGDLDKMQEDIYQWFKLRREIKSMRKRAELCAGDNVVINSRRSWLNGGTAVVTKVMRTNADVTLTGATAERARTYSKGTHWRVNMSALTVEHDND